MNALQRLAPLAFAALAAAVAAGCGGGGAGSVSAPPPAGSSALTPAAPPAAQGAATAVFQLGVPASPAPGAQSAHRAASVSAGTNGLAIAITPAGGTPQPAVVYSVGPFTGGICATPAPDGSRTCSFSLAVPVGSSTATITTYNRGPVNGAFDPTARALGTATVPIQAVQGAVTTVPIVLSGYVYRVTVGFPQRPQLGAPGTSPVLVTAYDGSGRAIVGADPYANPITLAFSDPTGSTSISTTSVTSPSTAVTLTYNGATMLQPAVVGATFAPLPNLSPTPVPSFTPSPAAFYPAMPFADPNTSKTFVQTTTTTVTAVNPLPSTSPYPIYSGNLPRAGTSTSGTQLQAYLQTPPPSPAPQVNGTPVAAVLQQFDQFPLTSTGQTGDTQLYYYNLAPNGNRIDFQRTGQLTFRNYAYPKGSVAYNQAVSWIAPLVEARAPLTAGDTWTNALTRRTTSFQSDTRPGSYYTYQNASFNYAGDGSYTMNISNTVNNAFGGGVDTFVRTVRLDGSWHEVDTYSTASGGSLEIDDVPAAPTASSVLTETVTNGLYPGTFTYTLPAPYRAPLPHAGSTSTVTGPGPLDPQCLIATPPGGAYAVTETSTAYDPTVLNAPTTSVTTTYRIPGAGKICQTVSSTSETHFVNVLVQSASNGSWFGQFGSLSNLFTTVSASTQIQQFPNVSTLTLSAGRTAKDDPMPGSDGVDPTLDADGQLIQRLFALEQAKGQARHTAASAARGNR